MALLKVKCALKLMDTLLLIPARHGNKYEEGPIMIG
jgi:hypothetical protein